MTRVLELRTRCLDRLRHSCIQPGLVRRPATSCAERARRRRRPFPDASGLGMARTVRSRCAGRRRIGFIDVLRCDAGAPVSRGWTVGPAEREGPRRPAPAAARPSFGHLCRRSEGCRSSLPAPSRRPWRRRPNRQPRPEPRTTPTACWCRPAVDWLCARDRRPRARSSAARADSAARDTLMVSRSHPAVTGAQAGVRALWAWMRQNPTLTPCYLPDIWRAATASGTLDPQRTSLECLGADIQDRPVMGLQPPRCRP